MRPGLRLRHDVARPSAGRGEGCQWLRHPVQVVANCEERLSEDQVELLLSLVKEHLAPVAAGGSA